MPKQKLIRERIGNAVYEMREETVNLIISKCSKLTQKEYKSRHDWVGKVTQ